jgi:hypothetical protein
VRVVNGRSYGLLFWTTTAAIAAVIVYLHALASLTLPVPWGDEAFFVWQARGFERWNSFIAPELDASRPQLLLPFVYPAVLGAAFKVFGFSLELARDISLVFVLSGFWFLALLVRWHRAPAAAMLLIGAFLVNAHFVAMANNARMEGLLFAVVCGALLLIDRGRAWMAIAVLSVSPMIHPNGIFFLVPAAIFCLVALRAYNQRPSAAAIAVFVLSAFIWAANGLYAVSYWEGFVHDTAMRVGETLSGHTGFSQFGGRHALGLVCIIATAAIGAWQRIPIGHLLVFAVSSWLMSRVRIEQWYEPFADFAYLLTSLALLEIAMKMLTSSKIMERITVRTLAGGVLVCLLLAINWKSGTIQGPRNYLQNTNAYGMRFEGDVPYFTAEDRREIGAFLESFDPQREVVIEVYPWGDGLLIGDVDESRILIQVPHFDRLFYPPEKWAWGYGPTEYRNPDLYLIRTSRYTPDWLKHRDDKVIARALQRSGVEKASLLRSRDGTEIWYAIRPTAKTDG